MEETHLKQIHTYKHIRTLTETLVDDDQKEHKYKSNNINNTFHHLPHTTTTIIIHLSLFLRRKYEYHVLSNNRRIKID